MRGTAFELIGALALLLALVPSTAAATGPAAVIGPNGAVSPEFALGSGRLIGATINGCGAGQQSVSAGAIAGLPRVTIDIYDGFYLPNEITVRPGTVVVWVNHGSAPHTTTAWDRWDSGVLWPGDGCAAWFVTPGTYSYLSIVAADGSTMTGTVTVAGSPVGADGMTVAGLGAGPASPGASPDY
jgi:plastocyanin